MGQFDWDAVHNFFGLTYATHLVWPRSVMQSMPNDWQRRFSELAKELEEAVEEAGLNMEPPGGYALTPRGGDGKFISHRLEHYRHAPHDLRMLTGYDQQ